MMEEKYRVSDIMVCAMARLIPDGSKVFHGVSSHMRCCLQKRFMRREQCI